MPHEGRRGGGGQDQGTSSLVKNRMAEGPTLSKTKDERVGRLRIVSRVDLCSTRRPSDTLTARLRSAPCFHVFTMLVVKPVQAIYN